MRAAKLVKIATLLSSQAVLITNDHSTHTDLVDIITKRIKGVIMAGRFVLVEYNVERYVSFTHP